MARESWSMPKDGTWQTLCTGECVGHKRIEQFDAVVTSKIRLRAISTKAKPHVRQLAGSPFRSIKEREISNKVFQATLDSAPERNRSAQERGV